MLPSELSTRIQTFLKPVEGFRISAGQKNNNKDCIIKIYSIRWVGYENLFFIQGARVSEGDELDPGDWSVSGGWGNGILISVPKPKNKYCDMVYPHDNKCFTGIEINKNNLLIESI